MTPIADAGPDHAVARPRLGAPTPDDADTGRGPTGAGASDAGRRPPRLPPAGPALITGTPVADGVADRRRPDGPTGTGRLRRMVRARRPPRSARSTITPSSSATRATFPVQQVLVRVRLAGDRQRRRRRAEGRRRRQRALVGRRHAAAEGREDDAPEVGRRRPRRRRRPGVGDVHRIHGDEDPRPRTASWRSRRSARTACWSATRRRSR